MQERGGLYPLRKAGGFHPMKKQKTLDAMHRCAGRLHGNPFCLRRGLYVLLGFGGLSLDRLVILLRNLGHPSSHEKIPVKVCRYLWPLNAMDFTCMDLTSDITWNGSKGSILMAFNDFLSNPYGSHEKTARMLLVSRWTQLTSFIWGWCMNTPTLLPPRWVHGNHRPLIIQTISLFFVDLIVHKWIARLLMEPVVYKMQFKHASLLIEINA